MKYRIFDYEVSGVPTFGLIPMSTDCSLQTAYYNPMSEELVLVSKDTSEEIDFVQKFDKFKNPEFEKGKATFERRMFNQNLTFRLVGEDMKDFIREYAVNSNKLEPVMEKIASFKKKLESEKTVEAEVLEEVTE